MIEHSMESASSDLNNNDSLIVKQKVSAAQFFFLHLPVSFTVTRNVLLGASMQRFLMTFSHKKEYIIMERHTSAKEVQV